MRKFYYTHEKQGVEMTCNVCGATAYFKRLKKTEIVGGKQIPEVYEAGFSDWTGDGIFTMCPECSKTQN